MPDITKTGSIHQACRTGYALKRYFIASEVISSEIRALYPY
jgi:hypothetical protein